MITFYRILPRDRLKRLNDEQNLLITLQELYKCCKQKTRLLISLNFIYLIAEIVELGLIQNILPTTVYSMPVLSTVKILCCIFLLIIKPTCMHSQYDIFLINHYSLKTSNEFQFLNKNYSYWILFYCVTVHY